MNFLIVLFLMSNTILKINDDIKIECDIKRKLA